MAAPDDLFDPRRDPRQRTALPTELQLGDWDCGSVELTEISSCGFRAACDRAFAPSTLVRVAIPGIGFRTARIRWTDGQTFGAEFCDPVDIRLLFLGGPIERRPTWLERIAA